MLSWGAKRKFIIIAVLVAVFVLVLGGYLALKLYTPPSCTDGKQNQGELGIDCGGPCARLCENQAPDLIVRWQRLFPVAQGSYNVVAYVENTNPHLGAREVSYSFKLYDKENVLVAERLGMTLFPPQRIIPIFEADVRTGNRSPSRTVFAFKGSPDWHSLSANSPVYEIAEQNIKDADTLPLLTARFVNKSTVALTNVAIVAIVYDTDDNARAASRTAVERVPPLGWAAIQFSWPASFGFTVGRIEITPLLFPDVNY